MLGTFLALLSSVCMASRELLSKRISADASGTVSAFATFLFALPFYLVLWTALLFCGVESARVESGFWFWIVCRALSDVGAEWSKMVAISYGELSLVSCVLALTPVIVLVLSPIITGDPITGYHIVGLLIVVSGSLLAVYRLPSERVLESVVNSTTTGVTEGKRQRAISFALLSSCFFALNNCFDRVAVQTATPVFSGMMMTVLSGLVLAPIALRQGGGRDSLNRAARPFLWRGCFEVFYMALRLSALVTLTLPVVIGFQRFALILTIIGGRVFFGERQTGRRLIAAVIIVTGTMILLYGELLSV